MGPYGYFERKVMKEIKNNVVRKTRSGGKKILTVIGYCSMF